MTGAWLNSTVSLPALMCYMKPGIAEFRVHEWLQLELTRIRMAELAVKPARPSLLKPTAAAA